MKPSAILTADWHLRPPENPPRCRVDNFWTAQTRKVRAVKQLQKKYRCAIYNAGDLFHHWKPSPYLISWCIDHLPYMYVVPGNHDLKDHSMKLIKKSGLFTLETADVIKILGGEQMIDNISISGVGWEQPVPRPTLLNTTRKVLIIHRMITPTGALPWPDADITTARSMIGMYKHFDLILSGDNHTSFELSKKKGNNIHRLVNPGPLSRQSADHINSTPCVYLWYAEENRIERVSLPFEKDVISREHIDPKREVDEYINSYVRKLKSRTKIGLDYVKNLENHLTENNVRTVVKTLAYKTLEKQEEVI